MAKFLHMNASKSSWASGLGPRCLNDHDLNGLDASVSRHPLPIGSRRIANQGLTKYGLTKTSTSTSPLLTSNLLPPVTKKTAGFPVFRVFTHFGSAKDPVITSITERKPKENPAASWVFLVTEPD